MLPVFPPPLIPLLHLSLFPLFFCFFSSISFIFYFQQIEGGGGGLMCWKRVLPSCCLSLSRLSGCSLVFFISLFLNFFFSTPTMYLLNTTTKIISQSLTYTIRLILLAGVLSTISKQVPVNSLHLPFPFPFPFPSSPPLMQHSPSPLHYRLGCNVKSIAMKIFFTSSGVKTKSEEKRK